MKKTLITMLISVGLLPLFFLNKSVLAQERNFKSSCSYSGTSGVEYNYCQCERG